MDGQIYLNISAFFYTTLIAFVQGVGNLMIFGAGSFFVVVTVIIIQVLQKIIIKIIILMLITMVLLLKMV